ncbi:hypothetical protein EDC32_10224 [Laceyella sacchari]|nr:hypothetical protein EDC32_10224 [Laceyella sacchari]
MSSGCTIGVRCGHNDTGIVCLMYERDRYGLLCFFFDIANHLPIAKREALLLAWLVGVFHSGDRSVLPHFVVKEKRCICATSASNDR